MNGAQPNSPGRAGPDTAGPSDAFLQSAGEMASLIAAKDWSATPLGPAEFWPRSLHTVLRILVTSRYAMWLGWGADLIFFYNDAYAEMTLGGKHPWALGQPASTVWSEIWPDVGPRAESAMRTGKATWDEGLLLFLERSGFPEETYHTFSYSPLPDDEGRIGGMLCVVTEETQSVIGERRLATLRELGAELAAVRTEPEVMTAIERGLVVNARDLPFTATWLFDPEPGQAHLACVTGIPREHPLLAQTVDLAVLGADDPFRRILNGESHVLIDGWPPDLALPTGAWDRPPRGALAVPISQQGAERPAGMLLAALNPYRPFDEAYQGFIDLVAAQVASGLASARAYEAERRRAEALAELDRAKTAFFSNISHEFRTPLTLMLGPLEEELIETAGEAAGRLTMVHRNGLRLLRLVNMLLDFSRIEAGRVRASFRPTDLAAYTGELASNFRSACERAGLTLDVDCPPLPHPVYVDADMWERVVLNLVSNAFKYTLNGGIRVSVEAAGDRQAQLVVSDTGVGIPADELPRIFDRFHRIEGQSGRTMEGTGIGLSLVHELVRLHGGQIAVQSQVNAGTTVRVSLPFGHAHLPQDQVSLDRGRSIPEGVAAASFVEEALRWLPDEGGATEMPALLEPATILAGISAGAAADGQRRRILLADDNADMRDYIMRLLGPRYDVHAVEDGAAALAFMQADRPDLLLSDVMMPRLDGFALLQAIRSDPELRSIPVILLSARAGDEARVEGLDAGADDYLVKPFGARELLARVRANLEMARIRREAAEQVAEEARRLKILNRTGSTIAAELDLERLVQSVTDAAVELVGAKFGAFFYNVLDETGEAYTLYTLSGASREDFAGFPMPRNTAVFEPTFRGEGIVRSDDILADPRYGRNEPYNGMPSGHLPVRSYLAVPVISRSGEVVGGLFFGHPDPGVFSERAELIVGGIAAQAAVGIDNARLYRASQQAQQGLRQLNETLEQRVAEEIAERMKAEEALRQAQKMEAVGQLTGGVAHDFNNLLTVITGGVEVLQRQFANTAASADSARVNRALRMIEQGANRAATLTQRLLAFARRQALDPRALDVNKLVSGMSELLRRTLGETIRIETVQAGGLWRSMADPNQLENALINLAVNARDAMPAGGVLTMRAALAPARPDEAPI
ncbi:MAG TPA: ATP-binding protein, partial [Acetobacteraceae bacterium]|nr:ATP-binding protein [Acetobacteraceae bacterium]